MRQRYVYFLASRPGGVIYTGVTNDLVRRVAEHRAKTVGGFTKKYGVGRLVYFEAHDSVEGAIQREKNIKHWPRAWKVNLINAGNAAWRDLYSEIV